MADSIKISVDVLAKDAAKELDKFLNNTKFQMLQLETAFKKGTISSAELQKELTKLEAGVKGYGVSTLKTEASIRALTNANLRAKNEFTSLGGKLNEINANISGKTNPAFISFNQIIQDAPFGIRGVGNNIQFLTQQFTHLRANGMSTTQILKGMLQNALTPMGGLMLAVSLSTSLLTAAMDYFGRETKETTKDLEKYKTTLKDIKDIEQKLGMSNKMMDVQAAKVAEQSAFRSYQEALFGKKTQSGIMIKAPVTKEEAAEFYKGWLEAKAILQKANDEFNKLLGESQSKGMTAEEWRRTALQKFNSEGNIGLPGGNAPRGGYRTSVADIMRPEVQTAKEYLELWDQTEKEKLAARERAVEESAKREEEIYRMTARVAGAGARAVFDSIFDAMNAAKRREERKEDRAEREKYQKEVDQINKSMRNEEQKMAALQAAEDRYYSRMDQLDMQRNSVWNNVWAAMRNTAINALEAILQKMVELYIFKQLMNIGFFGSGNALEVLPDTGGAGLYGSTRSGGGNTTGVAIAAASRKAERAAQNIKIYGKFVQSGADMVAVVEVNQLKRNTRSINVSR